MRDKKNITSDWKAPNIRRMLKKVFWKDGLLIAASPTSLFFRARIE